MTNQEQKRIKEIMEQEKNHLEKLRRNILTLGKGQILQKGLFLG